MPDVVEAEAVLCPAGGGVAHDGGGAEVFGVIRTAALVQGDVPVYEGVHAVVEIAYHVMGVHLGAAELFTAVTAELYAAL